MVSDWGVNSNAGRRHRWPGAAVCLLTVFLLGLAGCAAALGHGFWLDGGLGVSGPAFIGLLGLAAAGDDDIGRLIEKIERVENGDGDVDFETDREDDVGRLYDAVGSLVASAGVREQREGERYRREMYRITSDADLSTEEKIRRLLELGCERLDVENGLVTRIDEERERYEIETIAGGDFVDAGAVTGLVETFCRNTITADDVLDISDPRKEGLEDDPEYTVWNVNCYIGGKIEIDGELYGTACFVDPEPRAEPFGHDEKLFVDLLTRWVSRELELREHTAELRLRNRALESAPVGVTITDPAREDNPIVYANDRFEEVTGYPASEAVGRNCRFLQGEGTAEEPVAAMREAIDAAEPITTELRNYRRDGTEFWNRVRISPVENEAGEVTNFVGFQEDVTERAESERRLEAIVENTSSPIYIKDRDGVYEFVNDAAAAVFGRDRDEIVGKRDEELFDPERIDEVVEGDQRVIEGGETVSKETATAVDGEERIFIDNKYPYRDDDEIIGLVGISQDITDRKQNEQALRETTRQFEAVFDDPKMLVALLDPDGTLRQVNETAFRYVDADREAVIGESFPATPWWADTPADDVREWIDRAAGGEYVEFESSLDDPDGNRSWVRGTFRPVTNENGDVESIVVSARDVTDQKEYEEELQRQASLLDSLFEQLPVNIYVKDEDGRHVRTSTPYLREEYPDEEWFVGKTDLEIYHSDLAEEAHADDMRVIEEGEPVLQKVEFDGEDEEWLVTSKVPWRGTDGEIRGLLGSSQYITEQKERERELRETKQRLELVLEGTNTGIWEWDLATDDVTWNEMLERMVGLDPGEFEGTYDAFERRLHPADVPRVEDAIDEAVETNEMYQTEFRLRHEDGHWIWVNARGRVVFDETGSRRMVGINNDITERKETERRLSRLIDNVPGYVYRSTAAPPWDVEFVSEGVRDIAGYDPEALESGEVKWDDDVIAERNDEIETVIEEAVDEREPFYLTYPIDTADGERRWVQEQGRGVYGPDGSVEALEGVVIDVTDRKRREQELRERERHLEQYKEYTENVLDAIDDVFYLVDEEWNLKRWNESLVEVTGFTDEEVAEMNARDFFAEDDAERIVAALDDIENRVGDPLEAKLRTKGGEAIPFEFIAAPLADPDGSEVVAGIGRDITERKRYQRELERTTDLLQRVQGMAAIGGWELDLRTDPPETTWTDEMYRLHDLSPDAEIDLEVILDAYHPDDRDRIRETVETSMENGSGYDVEARMVTGSDDARWVRAMGDAIHEDGDVVKFRGAVQDITEQKEREAELERTKYLLEQAGRIAGVGGWELDLTTDPPEMTWTDELYDIHGLSRGTDVDVETTVGLYHPDDREYIQNRFQAAIERGESYDMEVRLQSGSDRKKWVRALGEAVYDGDEVVKLRGAIQDITRQKERELALESLHEATRGLLHTESEREVAELVVNTAASLFDIPGIGVYTIDDLSNRLVPVAYTDAFEALSEGAPAVGVGDDAVVWNCFATGERVVFDDAEYARTSQVFGEDVDSGLLVPMGDHGVFVVATDGPRIDDETRRLAETLVATTEAAFDRLASEADLRKRDEELEARNQRLRRQVGINDIIRRVDQSLVGATSREEVESAVCDRLVESDDVAFAWIGEADGSNGELVPRTWAGNGQTYLDALPLDRPAESGEPALVTATTGEATVVSNVVDRLREEEWRRETLANGFHSVISVPLRVDDYTHGVLAVYAEEPGVFGDLERTVFDELGQSIANAIDAVSAREALHADTVVELTLRFDDPNGLLARVARDADCEVEYEGISTRSADQTRLFFATAGASGDDVEAVLEDLYAVTEFRLVSESDDGRRLFEATVTGTVLPSLLVDQGASPRSIRATPDGTDAVVDLPTTTDVREFVEILGEEFPSVELRSRRNVERGMGTRQQLLSSLMDELTDRQVEVLRTAYFAGFFEWPRASTGEEVAEMLDVTQPTVNRHLRLGQQRLLSQLFDEDSPDLVAA